MDNCQEYLVPSFHEWTHRLCCQEGTNQDFIWKRFHNHLRSRLRLSEQGVITSKAQEGCGGTQEHRRVSYWADQIYRVL
jgi:hypothetical protein